MTLQHKEIFERYVYAGAIAHDAEAVAQLFTEDGVYEAPLLPEGHALPRRMTGRAEIRSGVLAYHRQSPDHGTVNIEQSGYVLHDTAEPDVFIAEIDTVLDTPDGRRVTMSLVQIFRLRDGRIASLRDYFSLPSAEV